MKAIMIIYAIILWSGQSLVAQSLNKSLISKDTLGVSHRSFTFLAGETDDGGAAIKGLFHFYKHYISSQDGQKCAFSPSCSEYAYISIKKKGLIFGVIDFFDRFVRCNIFSPEKYVENIGHSVLMDTVE